MYNIYTGFYKKQRDKYFRAVLRNHFKKDKMIIDIGCGQGDFLFQAKELGFKADGVDGEDFWVEYCHKRNLNVRKGSIMNLPYENESIASMFAQSVFEHIDAMKGMKEVSRIMEKNGKVAISCPTPANSFWDNPDHVRPYTIKSLETLFEMFDFKVTYKNYVFAELVGLKISLNGLYQLLNLIPASIGSNIIVIGIKK